MAKTQNQFNVGDRVVLARPNHLDRLNHLKQGMVGTVRRIGGNPLLDDLCRSHGIAPISTVLVQFDGYTRGTTGGDAGDGTLSYRNIAVERLEYADTMEG